MGISGELDPMPENRTQFTFKNKREHIYKVKIPNFAYSNQHIDTEKPLASRDHAMEPDTLKVTFNLGIGSTEKILSVVINISRALVRKKMPILISKEIDTITNVKRSCFKLHNHHPLDWNSSCRGERVSHQEVSTRMRQREELN